MSEKRYIISEVASRTGLEAHVLRYWEEELGLVIARNELGHRYYTEEQILLFLKVKELRDKGYQLKAIKSELCDAPNAKDDKNMINRPDTIKNELETVHTAVVEERNSENNKDKMEQFKAIISGIVTKALQDNNGVIEEEVSYRVSNKVIKEMDYLLRVKEEAEEDRYKKLDETIRNCQKNNKEAAAGKESVNRKARRKKGFR
ncbi:MAG: helix-turn-helix domain-containing protein [Butyrivibrio sp.]